MYLYEISAFPTAILLFFQCTGIQKNLHSCVYLHISSLISLEQFLALQKLMPVLNLND